jgi:large subunit ribosomal protein L6
MSRVGKKPIAIPEKTQVSLKADIITVKGPKGTLTRQIHPGVKLDIGDSEIRAVIDSQDRKSRALQGLVRSLVANMVTGVSVGFERVLQINGIGYRAEAKGKSVLFNLGYSHPIDFPLPEGITAEVDKNNTVKLTGIDKELLGQTAASIRQLRAPEPYKGKGIKYADENIKLKAGNKGTK